MVLNKIGKWYILNIKQALPGLKYFVGHSKTSQIHLQSSITETELVHQYSTVVLGLVVALGVGVCCYVVSN